MTRIELFSDHRTGKGQSESVGENRILLFEIELITQATIATYGLEGLTPDDLKRGDRLREFAAAFATRAEASLPG